MKHRTEHNGTFKSALMTLAVVIVVVGLAAAGFAAEGGGAHHPDTGAQLKDFAWRVLDFAVLAGILVWALKKADVRGSLKKRQSDIEAALREAVLAREAAEQKFAEYRTKLEKANEEIEAISTAIREEGAREKARIIAEANVTADKIRNQARQTAEQEVLKARAELRAEAARLAVEMAEQTLKEKINKNDQDRLVGEYLTKVVELH